jgi:hypothetical protein
MLSYLIEMVHQEFKFTYGLAKPIKLKGTKKISSVCELLKCWALLLSIGHLHGTFAFEKASLKLICRDDKLKANFLNRFRNSDIYNKAKKIVEREDYYRLYHLLTILKLRKYSKRSKKTVGDKALLNRFKQYVSYYINPVDQSLRRAKDVYNVLRRIAYIILDTHYCNILFSFQNTQITAETIKASLKKENDGYSSNLWDALGKFLYFELYKSTSSIFIENLAYRSLFLRMKSKQKDLKFIVNQLFVADSSFIDQTFNKYLKKNKIDLNGDHGYKEELKLSISGISLFNLEKDLDRLRSIINQKDDFLNYDVCKNPRGGHNTIYLFFRKMTHAKHNPRIIDFCFRFLCEKCLDSENICEENMPEEIKKILNVIGISHSFLNSDNWTNLLVFLFKIIFKERCATTIDNRQNPRGLNAMFLGPAAFRDIDIQQIKNDEVKMLLSVVESIYSQSEIKNKIVIFPYNIKLRDKKNKDDLGDIDTALLNMTEDKKLVLYLLQSKKLGQSYSKVEKQAKVIKNLLLSKYCNKNNAQIEKMPKGKVAVLKINLK